ncbi:MAG: 2-oxoacid:acceptor oxidoreductase subunit alpha [Nitrososphaerales archaeon]|nr:2-oxoacid:acceptor oxidoreductase subunit alpha [Nitrososphaerales archaeon]
MAKTDVTVRLGGTAGDGVQSGGELIARIFSRSGLYISTYNGNQSLIRGGQVWFHVHAAPWRVSSLGFGIDFLISLTQSFYNEHHQSVNDGGYILYDASVVKADDLPAGVTPLAVPLREIALKYDKRPIMRNVVAAGALAAALGIDKKVLSEAVSQQFGSDTLKGNVLAGNDAYSFFHERFGVIRKLDYCPVSRPFMTANEALALGAVAGGCRFYAAYPMSPASSIVHWMASHSKSLGITVFLGEDEISVINSVIGASFAGARAMCGTSGGGFALMQEAIGMAAMTETPVVVVDVMRAGPSTGLPTKTSQGDLNMVLGIAQDDFPRVIIAPRTPQESFYAAGRALNIAEKFQVPVIILLDFSISEGGYSTVDALNFDAPIDRGKIVVKGETNGVWFKRFELTPDNVSPRSLPGTDGMMFVAKSDEHDEYGHDLSDVLSGLKESVKLRERMYEKRMRKLDLVRKEMSPPEFFGPDKADLTVVTWGSSANPVREAIRELRSQGVRANSLEFSDLYPLDATKVRRILQGCGDLLGVECNYTGQFSGYLKRETGVTVERHLLKYSGEPIYPVEVVNSVKDALAREVSAVA